MKYLQRLSKELRHYDSLPYLTHDKNKSIKMMKNIVKYSDMERIPKLSFILLSFIVAYKKYELITEKNLYYLHHKILGTIYHHGNIRCVKLLTKLGISKDELVFYGNGHPKCIELLLKLGYPPDNIILNNSNYRHPKCMKMLCRWVLPKDTAVLDYPECIKQIMDFDYDKFWTLLLNVCKGNIFLMKKFHEYGYTFSPTGMDSAAFGYPKSMKLLRKWGTRISEITMRITTEGNSKCMKLLHKWYPDPNLWRHIKPDTVSNKKCKKLLYKWNIFV